VPKRSDAHLAARRRQILDGARRAFARHGYEGATVKVLEAETGLSRGAIFHHFPDKDSLFLALAEQDASEIAVTVERDGLVQVMRELPQRDAGWLGVQLEVARRLRTDAEFRRRWQRHLDTVTKAAEKRLRRGRGAGTVRDDVPTAALVSFLWLVHDGLVLHLAAGLTDRQTATVLDLAESVVRKDSERTTREQP
jgi:AcrR family transcriptional regulator